MSRGLVLISMGLHDERDMSLRALEESRRCDTLYLEPYTTKLETDAERLSSLIGRPVKELSRGDLEERSHLLLDEASRSKVGVLVGGDCLTATTHISLLLEAKHRGVPTGVIHGSSILTAVAETGLSPYKFGRTVTLPFPYRGPADTVLKTLGENLEHGLHTLVLLDIDAESHRYLGINQALKIMLDTGQDDVFNRETLVVGAARLGSENPILKAGAASEIAEADFGHPPHAMIVPGSLHFVEEEALKAFDDCPDGLLNRRTVKGETDRLIEKYTAGCSKVLKMLRRDTAPKEIGEEEVKDLIEHAQRYLEDAEYYAAERKPTALASVSYCEGILDALRLLGLVNFEW